MTRGEKLAAEIRTWSRNNRGARVFAKRLAEAVDHIDAQLTGEERERMLDEAEAAFERQRESLANVRRAISALQELNKTQMRLVDMLLGVTAHRPPDATLH